MTAAHADRQIVYDSLKDLIGSEASNKLMDLLPRHPETDLVTRTDMHANTSILQGVMAELRGEMNEKFGLVEARFGAIDEKFGLVFLEFGKLRTEISDRFERQQRWLIGLLVTIIVAVIGSAIGIVILN